jgi:type II secretory pathway component PulF
MFVKTKDGRLHLGPLQAQDSGCRQDHPQGDAGALRPQLRHGHASGVPIVQGLSLVGQVVENAWIEKKLEDMRMGVERGESVLRTAVASGVFTPVVLQMVMVGEESGSLDDMMLEIADMYQREVEYELKTLSAQIEPILIVPSASWC